MSSFRFDELTQYVNSHEEQFIEVFLYFFVDVMKISICTTTVKDCIALHLCVQTSICSSDSLLMHLISKEMLYIVENNVVYLSSDKTPLFIDEERGLHTTHGLKYILLWP